MKILKNPNPVSTNIKVCPKCECEFEYTEEDVQEEQGMRCVCCPNCSTPVDITEFIEVTPEELEPNVLEFTEKRSITQEEVDNILSYIERAIPDIARKCGVMQEDVINCFKQNYGAE